MDECGDMETDLDFDFDSEDRVETLGYRPQKEIVYNKMLPYADKLDEESAKLFSLIKTNLVKAFLAREIRPGCALWTSRLHRYMKIYGLKFSKEDHICLIKLFYELIVLPNLEPSRINKFSCTLTHLLRKRQLLSRDDLQLDWRPLHDLVIRILKKSNIGLPVYKHTYNILITLDTLIKSARIYFPVTATQEILDEFRPELCPYSQIMTHAVSGLDSFLPIVMKQEEAHLGYKLWFEELMTLWETCHNNNQWENEMVSLMSKLAFFNIGHINWEPYVPIMFVRFMRSLQLPVGYKQKLSNKQFRINMANVALWIVSALGGPTDTIFVHLEKFMQTLESYFHSANSGRWSSKIRELLKKLSYQFVMRIHNERYKKRSWEPEIPKSHKLSDADIDRFVLILKPCVEQIIYSRSTQDMTATFNYLGSLRPNIIIPLLLDKLYFAMDTLTEPHKLTSSMICVSSVARYMVQGKRVSYPEGPTHVIPLLFSLLPGIDPNDVRKCYMTFNFIVQFVNIIPLINSSDASQYYDDLTEEESVVCAATADFEDFVLQFFDRLCVWVESNSLEMTRLEQNDNDWQKTKAELVAEHALVSVILAVLTQCSTPIFMSALKKIQNFVTSRILEIKVSGKLVAAICHSFARTRPKETAKVFIPHFCDVLDNLLFENDDIVKEERIDGEILYNLLLLSEVVDVNTEIVNYMDRLKKILNRVLHMSCLQANLLGTRMLNMMMTSLSFIQPVEYRSSAKPYDASTKEFLSVREWGVAGDINDLNIKWYVPEQKEIDCVQDLLESYLVPELNNLKDYADGKLNLTREELRKKFKIISACLGCHTVLPLWDEPVINLKESVLDPSPFELTVGSYKNVYMPDGSNVRKAVADTIHHVQRKILENDEGDTKSIFSIIHIYDVLLFNKFRGRDFEMHWKNFHMLKLLTEDKLHKNKKHLRHILIDRVMLHQEFRNESRSCTFTNTHKQILLDLFKLSTCRYSEVRVAAQGKVFNVVNTYSYSFTVLTEPIMEILQIDSVENHERFKGCLYILLGPQKAPIVARHDWVFIRNIWPLLVRSKPSEKLSIVSLMDSITDCISKHFPTIAINLEIPEKCFKVGWDLARSEPSVNLASFQGTVDASENALKERCRINMEAYQETVQMLLESASSGKLQWRYELMAMWLLHNLVHPDVKYPPNVVQFFLKSLISDSINIRKISVDTMLNIFYQNKLPYKKIEIETHRGPVKPGIREDNEWLLYNSSRVPKCKKDWNEPRYVQNDYSGFYAWPKKMEVYASADQQPSIYNGEMTEQRKIIYEFFMDKGNIEVMIKYYSLEEKKGKDIFNGHRFMVYKNIFKMLEDQPLTIFIPHLQRLVEDKQEQSQRCAAEIIAGVISGSKHWSFPKAENLWNTLLPILRTAISNLSEETLADWGNAMSVALNQRDPNRYHRLLEFLMDNPLSEQSSFISCARIYLLQSAVNTNLWRNAELVGRSVDYFKNHLSHQYQNVRNRISWCLTYWFGKDVMFPSQNAVHCPRVDDFFVYIMPELRTLYETTLQILGNNGNGGKMAEKKKGEVIEDEGDSEKEKAIRMFKVVSKYVSGSIVRMFYSAVPSHYKLLPLACVMQSNEVDDELSTISTNLIAVLANSVILEKYMPAALEAIQSVAKCPFWSGRAAIAEFIPVFVFHNMATIISNPKWVTEIEVVTLELLQDTQPEVRIRASHIISGLLHCSFLSDPMKLLASFKKMAKTSIKNKQSDAMVSKLKIRHAGVLGMCSFINAHPYDVPDFIAGILSELGPHLNDPQPIPTTIRKTLGDFKRTHHANWEVHKLKFTEDELSVLSDLTLPPSYYA